jgi:hypothetical protein
LVEESPGVPAIQNELGRTAAHLGELLLRLGRATEAREQCELAIRHQQEALKLVPGQPAYRRALGQHYAVLAESLLQLGDHAAAARVAAELPRPSPPDEQWTRLVARILARCIPLAERDSTLPAEKRQALAQSYGDEAVAILRQGPGRGSGPGLGRLDADPNLAPLRPRADFQRLVRDLEGAAGPGDK